MSIVKTITDEYAFWEWLKQSGSYSNNFSAQGAKALQAWFDEYSDETKTGMIEFDPITWCVEFSEYKDVDDFNDNYFGKEYKKGSEYTLDTLKDNTTVIEFDGGIIVGDF